MTRLTASDIAPISESLIQYHEHLKNATGGYGLFGIGCRCWNIDQNDMRQRIRNYSVKVIPSTAGLGVITNFSESVATILRFLGFSASVAESTDVKGLAETFTSESDAFFMADDQSFISYDLKRRKFINNSSATGRIFATALRLMAADLGDVDDTILVIGCGQVGFAAAEQIINCGGSVTLIDTNKEKCNQARVQLIETCGLHTEAHNRITLGKSLKEELISHRSILDATPTPRFITNTQLRQDTRLALPGVPAGISDVTLHELGHRAIHDKLELGVTAMALGLFA